MARTKQGPITYIKYYKVWLKDWDKVPHQKPVQLESHLEKMRIYFPKTIRYVRPATLFLKTVLAPKRISPRQENYNKLYKQISHKYKPDFYRHIKLYNHQKNSILPPTMKALQSLSLRILNEYFNRDEHESFFKKLLIQNNNLKTLELSSKVNEMTFIRVLKYIKSLVCLKINIPLSCENLEALLSAMKYMIKLKSLEISGEVSNVSKQQQRAKSLFFRLLKQSLSCSNLRRFGFDGNFTEKFDINDMPFDLFRQKGINYDIRAFHSTDTITFSKENSQGLQELTFLGINFKKEWKRQYLQSGPYQDEHLQFQSTAKNLLFLNLFALPKIDLSNLFEACRNITTLDLILPKMKSNCINFSGLSELANLRHFFIHIEDISAAHDALFRNLSLAAQKYQTLIQIALHFCGNITIECCSEGIFSLFEACASTVNKVILEFAYTTESGKGEMDCIYKGLSKLLNLKSFIFYVKEMRTIKNQDEFLGYHSVNVERLLKERPSLEELHLLFYHGEFSNFKINFSEVINLKKLCLDVSCCESLEGVIESILGTYDLRYLKLMLFDDLSLENWRKVVKGLRKLPSLETIKIRFGSRFCEFAQIKEDLTEIIRTNQEIRCIKVRNYYSPEFIYRRKNA